MMTCDLYLVGTPLRCGTTKHLDLSHISRGNRSDPQQLKNGREDTNLSECCTLVLKLHRKSITGSLICLDLSLNILDIYLTIAGRKIRRICKYWVFHLCFIGMTIPMITMVGLVLIFAGPCMGMAYRLTGRQCLIVIFGTLID